MAGAGRLRVPSTEDGDDPSTVRSDSTRPPINTGQGSNRRVTAGALARTAGDRSLKSKRVELLRVDVEHANGGDGLLGGHRSAAGQLDERRRGNMRRVDLEERTEVLASPAPPEAIRPEGRVIRRQPTRDHVRERLPPVDRDHGRPP